MKKICFLLLVVSVLFFACDNKKKVEGESTSTTTTTDKSVKPTASPVASSIKEYYGLDATGKTRSGYEFIKHVDTKGDLIKEGEYAYFRYYIKKRDSILSSSSGQDIGRFKIPSEAEITEMEAKGQPSPVLDGVLQMAKGDSLSVYFPASEFPTPVPGFENEAYLTYSLFLEDIKDEAAYNKDMEELKKKFEAEQAAVMARADGIGKKVSGLASDYTGGKLKNKLKSTPSGLKYIIHEEGKGKQAENGKTVLVQYYGATTDGKMFDNSFKRGQAFNFPLGQGRVIKGWDEGIALLKEGTKATLFIPSELGYGAAGSPPNIPGDAELIFYVELEKVL